MGSLSCHRNRNGWVSRTLAGLCLAGALALAGCAQTPDFGPERDQVRAIQHNNAVAATETARSTGRRAGDLGDDGYRAIRYAIAKPAPTPSDAARLPYGSNKVLMQYLFEARFRRYGPAIVRLLGMIGDDAELAFLRNYLENENRGGVDEYTYRTLLAVPEAIGYLAIHNNDAYATLRDYLRLQFWRENIAWRFAAKDRELNAYRMAMASLDGLVISGRQAGAEYVRYIIKHQSGDEVGKTDRTRTLMDERLEARAKETIAALEMAN